MPIFCSEDSNLSKNHPIKLRISSTGLSAATIWMALVLAAASQCLAGTQSPNSSEICDQAAVVASRSSGIPLDVLRAISRAETGRLNGRALQPWPWTVNMEGAGEWFDTEDQARAFVFSHFKRGARSFDVGCFQINYKWHGQAFRSIDEMFDPVLNAKYAAGFLKRLYAEFGDWRLAAGAYHSRTPEFAEKYIARFDRIRGGISDDTLLVRANIDDGQQSSPVHPAPLMHNAGSAPLFGEGSASMGSLFPISRNAGILSRPFVALR